MHVQPYLFFEGRCEEALEFYKTSLGAQVGPLMHYKDSPDKEHAAACPPGLDDKVMHAELRVGTTTLFASDGMANGNPKFDGFSLSLTVESEAEADRVFAALAQGGQIRMPLMKTFWSPKFGMVADQFGVGWMISLMP